MSDFTKSARYRRCQALFERRYPDFRDAGQRYQEIIASLLEAQTTLLDLGCGRDSLAAEQLRAAQLSVGVDLDLLDLQHNRSVAYHALANGEGLPFAAASFDLLISQWVIEHLEYPQRVFLEIARVLRPGGHAVLFTTNARNYIPLATRLVPQKLQGQLLERFLRRPTHESFPTFYRANTRRKLALLAQRAGLQLETPIYVGNPFYLAFSPVLFRLALLFERLTDHAPLQSLKLYLIVTLHKPL